MDRSADRLRREIEFHRRIADRAEIVWNWDSPAGRVRARRRVELFVEHGGLRPGVRGLELGCGTAIFLSQVAASGARLHGLDLSDDLLAKARGRVASLANVSLERGNAEGTPFRDGSFDVVYGSSILHHLDLDRALGEAHRVLRPGGRLVFAEPNMLNPQVMLMFHVNALKPYFAVSADEQAFSRFRARAALEKARFVEVQVRPFDFLHPRTPAALLGPVAALGKAMEAVPLAREIAGSLLLTARRA
jgi:SAM-dependent methyltransferase